MQKPSERFQRGFRYVMLNSFGVSFSSFNGYAQSRDYVIIKPSGWDTGFGGASAVKREAEEDWSS